VRHERGSFAWLDTSSVDARAAALPHWIDLDDDRRPHDSLGGRPPIRVPNRCRQDT